jgi:hypothetical protein
MTRLRDIEARAVAATPDCGDNSCQFALEKKGMRTNGGCRCFSERSMMKSQPLERYALVLRTDYFWLLARLKECEAALDRISEEWHCGDYCLAECKVACAALKALKESP